MANPLGIGGQQKGEPGRNPAGRPKKEQSLTHLLREQAHKSLIIKGKTTTRAKLLASMLWSVAIAAQTKTVTGKTLDFNPKDWYTVVKFIYDRVEGLPRQAIDFTRDPDDPDLKVTADEMATAILELKKWQEAQDHKNKG